MLLLRLNHAVNENSLRSVARSSGLTQSAIHRYLQGIGEPSHETLCKLSEYFKLPIWYLRGENPLGGEAIDKIRTLMPDLERARNKDTSDLEREGCFERICNTLKELESLAIYEEQKNDVKEMKAERQEGKEPGIVPKRPKS